MRSSSSPGLSAGAGRLFLCPGKLGREEPSVSPALPAGLRLQGSAGGSGSEQVPGLADLRGMLGRAPAHGIGTRA